MWGYGSQILKQLQLCCDYMTKQFKLIQLELEQLRKEVRGVRFLVNRPSSIGLVCTEEKENGMIKFQIALPAPPVVPSDWAEIVSGKLSVKIGDADPLVFTTAKALQEVEPRRFANDALVGPQTTLVEMVFRYVDDAGNESAAVANVQELRDTVPPVAPTSIGLVETEELPD